MNPRYRLFGVIISLITILACSFGGDVFPEEPTAVPPSDGLPQRTDLETVTVAHVVDGDIIELTDGCKVRYIGMNTLEWNQPYCDKAKEMNRELVGNREVQPGNRPARLCQRVAHTIRYHLWFFNDLA